MNIELIVYTIKCSNVCSNNVYNNDQGVTPFSGQCVGITDEDGSEYRGTVSVSVSGHVCQRWDSQSPNEHTKTPER